MYVLFRHANDKDLEKIRELALKGLPLHYNNFPKAALERLAAEYHSDEKIKKSLQRAAEGNDYFIVAEIGGKVAGFCHIVTKKGKKSTSELSKLYIDGAYTGKGLGSNLLGKGEAFAKQKGCVKYIAYANMHNRQLCHFFLKNGFRHFDEKDRVDEFSRKILWHFEKVL
jgi:N-acetylglutamate synthase-like GNAT family acetyltransferase